MVFYHNTGDLKSPALRLTGSIPVAGTILHSTTQNAMHDLQFFIAKTQMQRGKLLTSHTSV